MFKARNMWIAIPGVNHFPEKKGKMCYVIFAESSYLFKKSSEFVKSIASYVLVKVDLILSTHFAIS